MHREIRLYILGKYLSWDKGRQLTAFGNITFTYNASGIRTSKTVGGTKHSYTLDGTKILKETWGDNTTIPLYSNEGDTCGIIYNGEPYYFIKNLQGDIISVTEKNGNTIAKYSYDAWGVCTIISDSSNCNIATVNSYRYRGYYYDTETKLYYIQTRYYDPAVGRFINADYMYFWDIDKSSFATNQFHYCNNDPINNVDRNGKLIGKIIARAVVGAMYGALMQYITDVLENLSNCIVKCERITSNIWYPRSGIAKYLLSMGDSALDATLCLGRVADIIKTAFATILDYIIAYFSGDKKSLGYLIKNLIWEFLLGEITGKICQRFYPKKTKELYRYIRNTYNVKGTRNYENYWILFCECIEWNGFMISSVIDSIKSGCEALIDFIEGICQEAFISAFESIS